MGAGDESGPCGPDEMLAMSRDAALVKIRGFVSEGKRMFHPFKTKFKGTRWEYQHCLAEMLESLFYYCEVNEVEYRGLLGSVAASVRENMDFVRGHRGPARGMGTFCVMVRQVMEWRRAFFIEAWSEQEAEYRAASHFRQLTPQDEATFSMDACSYDATRCDSRPELPESSKSNDPPEDENWADYEYCIDNEYWAD